MSESLRDLCGDEAIFSQHTESLLDELAHATDVLDLLDRANRISPPEMDLWSALVLGGPCQTNARLYVHCPAPLNTTVALALADSMAEELCACVEESLQIASVETASLSYGALQAEMVSDLSDAYHDHLTLRGADVVGVTRAAASVTDSLTPGRWRETAGVLEIAAWMLGALTDEDAGSPGIIDPISGVHTRAFFEAMLNGELARHQRAPSELSVVLLQLRRSVALLADEHPSPTVLVEAGRTMQRTLRESDVIARLDERRLAALLPCTGPRAGLMAATRLGETLQDNEALEGWSIDIGVSGLGLETASPEELVDQAAHAMSSAQRGSSTHPFVYI